MTWTVVESTLFAAISQQCFSLTLNQHQPASSTFLSQQISTSHQRQHSEHSHLYLLEIFILYIGRCTRGPTYSNDSLRAQALKKLGTECQNLRCFPLSDKFGPTYFSTFRPAEPLARDPFCDESSRTHARCP